MKTLLILRHAKSSWKDASLADHDRPLNQRGKRDAPAVGMFLSEQELVPQRILSSTAVRARKTSEQVAKHCGFGGQVELVSELYLAPPQHYVDVLRQIDEPCGTALVVGHNPGLEELLEGLVGQYHRLATAALAQVGLEVKNWHDLQFEPCGNLVQLWRPPDDD